MGDLSIEDEIVADAAITKLCMVLNHSRRLSYFWEEMANRENYLNGVKHTLLNDFKNPGIMFQQYRGSRKY